MHAEGDAQKRARGGRLLTPSQRHRKALTQSAESCSQPTPCTTWRRVRAGEKPCRQCRVDLSAGASGMRLLARAEPAGLGDQEQHFGKPVDRAAHALLRIRTENSGWRCRPIKSAMPAAPLLPQQLARCPPSVNFLRRLPTAALLLSLPRCCSLSTDRLWPAFRAAAG